MPLKRKFAFNLSPIKTTLGIERSENRRHTGFLHSPFFSPPSPTIDRPVLAPQLEAELRNTLVRVLRDINKPSETVHEDMLFKRKSPKGAREPAVEAKGSPKHKHAKTPSFSVPGTKDDPQAHTAAKRYDSGIVVDGVSRSSTAKDDSQPHSGINPTISADDSPLTTDGTHEVNASAHSTTLTPRAVTPGDAGKPSVIALGFSKSEPSSADNIDASTGGQSWLALEFANRASQNFTAPAPPNSAQRPSSALPLTPVEETPSTKKESKRRNTVAQANPDALSRLTATPAVPVVDLKPTTPTNGKRISWWRRATISRRRSSASLKIPGVGSGSGTPRLDSKVPPLPRLDTSKWQGNQSDKNAFSPRSLPGRLGEAVLSPKSPIPKSPLAATHDSTENQPRPSSAVIIDANGEERALSRHEERKRDSDIQGAVKLKMISGSLKSTPSTPAVDTAEKKSFDFPRPGTSSTTRSVKDAIAELVKEELTSPVIVQLEVTPPTSAGGESIELQAATEVVRPPRTDSNTAPAIKSTTPVVPKLSTTNISTAPTLPKMEVESATPITPAIEELEDPYIVKPLEPVKSAEEVKKTQPRSSTFLKRFSSLKSPPARKTQSKPKKSLTVIEDENESPRQATMRQYGKMLEAQYEKPRSAGSGRSNPGTGNKSNARPVVGTKPILRSSSPTPSDLYAL